MRLDHSGTPPRADLPAHDGAGLGACHGVPPVGAHGDGVELARLGAFQYPCQAGFARADGPDPEALCARSEQALAVRAERQHLRPVSGVRAAAQATERLATEHRLERGSACRERDAPHGHARVFPGAARQQRAIRAEHERPEPPGHIGRERAHLPRGFHVPQHGAALSDPECEAAPVRTDCQGGDGGVCRVLARELPARIGAEPVQHTVGGQQQRLAVGRPAHRRDVPEPPRRFEDHRDPGLRFQSNARTVEQLLRACGDRPGPSWPAQPPAAAHRTVRPREAPRARPEHAPRPAREASEEPAISRASADASRSSRDRARSRARGPSSMPGHRRRRRWLRRACGARDRPFRPRGAPQPRGAIRARVRMPRRRRWRRPPAPAPRSRRP